MQTISENYIENNIIQSYSNRGALVKSQVKFCRKKIDIVYDDKIYGKICAIEVKLYDWKSALRQARQNCLAVDYSYVAIWHKGSQGAISNKDIFQQLGIGLIVINDDLSLKIIVEASKSDQINTIAYNAIQGYLHE